MVVKLWCLWWYLKKKQNTRDGFKWVEVGKKNVLLECGQEIELNLDGRSFYT